MPQVRCLIPGIGGLITSKRAERAITAPKALGELIDNSLDAGAKTVRISRRENRDLVVWDDGLGCSDLDKFVQFGQRIDKDGTLGMYGVGFCDVSMWAAEAGTVISRADGVRRTVDFDYEEMIRTGTPNYIFSDPVSDPGPPFTEVILRRMLAGRFRNLPETIRDRISYQYAPAIWKAKNLFFNEVLITAARLPNLKHGKSVSGVFRGRSWTMRAGLLDEPEIRPWHPGHTYIFGGRVLACTPDGMREYQSRKFFAIVEMLPSPGNRWELDRNKEGFRDSETEREFLDILWPDCQPLIREAYEEGETFDLDHAFPHLAQTLLEAYEEVTQRERRKRPGGAHGSVTPVGSPRRRENAASSDPTKTGSVKASKARQQPVSLVGHQWADLPDPGQLYEVQCGSRGTTVYLNQKNEFFATPRPSEEAIVSVIVQAATQKQLVVQLEAISRAFPHISRDLTDAEKLPLICGEILAAYRRRKQLTERRSSAR